MADPIYVGIDGGGTRTTALATDAAGRELARAEGAAGIVNALEPTAGAQALAALARSVARRAGATPPAAVTAVCCALAGAGRDPERIALETALAQTGVAERVRVTTDAEAALADALGDGAGILAIAGTGSIAWGRDAQGRTARVGGWGLVLGDEGSGYSIGLAALRAVVRAHDGRAPGTALITPVLQVTGVGAEEGLVAWAAGAAKADVGALAPAVFLAADAGDEPARAILAEAGAGLAEHVAALYRRLGPWPDPTPLAFAGSLIAPGGPLRPWLAAAVTRIAAFQLVERPVDAARGAAALARAIPVGG